MSVKDLRAFIERHDSRLVSRTIYQLSDRFEILPSEVLGVLLQYPFVREHPKGCWTYQPEIDPVHPSLALLDIEQAAKAKRKPRKPTPPTSLPVGESTPPAPAAPARPSPFDAFRR